MGLYRAEGIVLANRNLGEADRLVTLLCREQGKIEAVARGARRPRNRLVGLTLPFNILQVAVFSGRNLDELSQAEGINSLQGLRDDLVKMAYASYLVELTGEFLPERAPSPPVYDLLRGALERLDAGRDPEALARHFELHLLEQTGFCPALHACLSCGAPPGASVFFAPAEGGFFCPGCAVGAADLIRLPGSTLIAMARCLSGREDFTGLPREENLLIRRALRSFIEARLDKPLRSLKFLQEIT